MEAEVRKAAAGQEADHRGRIVQLLDLSIRSARALVRVELDFADRCVPSLEPEPGVEPPCHERPSGLGDVIEHELRDEAREPLSRDDQGVRACSEGPHPGLRHETAVGTKPRSNVGQAHAPAVAGSGAVPRQVRGMAIAAIPLLVGTAEQHLGGEPVTHPGPPQQVGTGYLI